MSDTNKPKVICLICGREYRAVNIKGVLYPRCHKRPVVGVLMRCNGSYIPGIVEAK